MRISYLETVGYKLAHYFGFVFADHFLEHVIPGYYRDTVTTMQYDWALREYLKIDISKLAYALKFVKLLTARRKSCTLYVVYIVIAYGSILALLLLRYSKRRRQRCRAYR